LPLNAITSQLKRLKESQVLEVLGGGKGRPASYTVPDKLFAIWYQMRYLNQNRRRIELFVEALRVWFEAQERFSILRALDELGPGASAPALREAAATAEYFAASLAGTGYETTAKDLAVRQWLRTGDHREAALALAGLAEITLAEGVSREASAYSTLGQWCLQHREPRAALVVLGRIIAARNTQPALLAEALVERGICKGALGDHEGALTDFSAVVVLDEVPRELVAMALFNRGVAKGMLGDAQGEIADYTAVVTLDGAPKEQVATALVNRGVAKGMLGDAQGAIADCTAVMTLDGAPKEQVAKALVNRGVVRRMLGDAQGAIADYTAVMTLDGVPKEQVAKALVNRGVAKGMLGDAQGAIADYTAVVTLEGAPKEQVAKALFNRGVARMSLDQQRKAIHDWLQVVEKAAGADETVVSATRALFRVSWLKGDLKKADWALDRLAQRVASLPRDECVARLTTFLAPLASPQIREGWAHACRHLLRAQPPEVKEALGFLDRVAAVVQGGDKGLLDPLPPEQREFAAKVLSELDAAKVGRESDGHGAPVQAKHP
jgi:hypothetical protein